MISGSLFKGGTAGGTRHIMAPLQIPPDVFPMVNFQREIYATQSVQIKAPNIAAKINPLKSSVPIQLFSFSPFLACLVQHSPLTSRPS